MTLNPKIRRALFVRIWQFLVADEEDEPIFINYLTMPIMHMLGYTTLPAKGRDIVLVERGLFCLTLAVIAKVVAHNGLLEWTMFLPAMIYIISGIVKGISRLR